MRATMRSLREVLEPLRDLVVGPPVDAPGGAPGDGDFADDLTTRVPDPPGRAYSERPRRDWVRRKTFRGRRRGERALLAAATLLVVGVLMAVLLPRGRSSSAATGGAHPAEGRRGQTWANP